ncbi:MAG: prolyl oligopeptidase family serine peptidase [Planctomycetota bacterium]
MNNKPVHSLFFLLLLLIAPANLAAQGTAEDYRRSNQLGRRYRSALEPLRLDYQWHSGGIVLKKESGGDTAYDYIDGRTGELRTVSSLDELNLDGEIGLLEPKAEWDASGGDKIAVDLTFENTFDRPVRLFWCNFDGGLQSYGEVPPQQSLTLSTFDGHQWVVDFQRNDLAGIFVAGRSDCTARLDERSRRIAMEDFGQPSPGQEVRPVREITVRDSNIWFDEENGLRQRLTDDGRPGDSYSPVIHYSPDGRFAICFKETRVDQRRVPMIASSPDDQVQPELQWMNYRKPGDELPQRIPALIDLEQGRRIEIDEDRFADSWSVQFKRWSDGGKLAYVLYNRRGHQELALLAIEAETGQVIDIARESSPTFVDYSQKTMLHWLNDTGQIIWASERDGWNHLYRIDATTGEIVNQITSGGWVVREVELVDEENQVIWFTAMGIHPEQDPYHRHLAKINFDGSGLTVLTEGDGTHRWEFNPDRTLFVDRWSRVDQPEIAELRRSVDGTLVCHLGQADSSKLTESGFQMPVRFAAPGRDGETMIYGLIIKPSNFDPEKTYPVIENIYSGPHDFHVAKRFGLQNSVRRIAELGFIVVQIDGMGTNWRSKAFHDVCWQNIVDGGMPDRIAWMKAAAEEFTWMDLSRVGIYGGSAGGQNAMAAVLHHGDFYKAAAADCGCHDNRMDKIWWNEAWMGAMGPHYEANSNVTHAHKLRGDLFLTVGELDRNVDPASTMQVVDALIKADKDFELVVVPGAGHGIGESSYLFRRRQDFFVRSLMGVEPRRDP